jgi:hypothetical protein
MLHDTAEIAKGLDYERALSSYLWTDQHRIASHRLATMRPVSAFIISDGPYFASVGIGSYCFALIWHSENVIVCDFPLISRTRLHCIANMSIASMGHSVASCDIVAALSEDIAIAAWRHNSGNKKCRRGARATFQ